MRTVTIALLSAIFSCQAWGYVAFFEDINASRELPIWVDGVVSHYNQMPPEQTLGYAECRMIVEIPGALLCGRLRQSDMNLALTRASNFVEGNGTGRYGVVLDHDDPRLHALIRVVGGHDLRGSDLIRFYEAMSGACVTDRAYCMNGQELELFEQVILPLAAQGEFVIITFSLEGSMHWYDVVTHEIFHAQYFLQPMYRQIVDEYWDIAVLPEEKENVRRVLSRYYNSEDELLMRNEFQAYILMSDAHMSMLAHLVSKHQAPLLDRLIKAGTPPLQIR